MISLAQLREQLTIFVELRGLERDRERAVIAELNAIAPQIHDLIRGEVLEAKKASDRFHSRELRS